MIMTDLKTNRNGAGNDRARLGGVIILEILVVMIILALLITLVAPNYLGLGESARVTVTHPVARR